MDFLLASAFITLVTNSFEAQTNALDYGGKRSTFGLASTADDNSPRSAASLADFNSNPTRHSNYAILRQCSLHDISYCVIADVFHNDSTSTTTQHVTASYDEIFQYSSSTTKNDDLHMNEVESVSAMSYSPKNWNSKDLLSDNSADANYNNPETLDYVRSTTSTVDRRNHVNVGCCSIVLVRRSIKIS